jgi:hypothetical protein
LIDPDGRLRAVKYGAHAYDQWSVDELLALQGTGGVMATPRRVAGADRGEAV